MKTDATETSKDGRACIKNQEKMGGGTSKSNQVQEYLVDNVTKVVNEQITEESASLTQAGVTNQLIANVVFKPWDGCPWWAPPRNLNVTQESVSAGIIAKSMERLDTANLTQKIVSQIEAASSNKVDKRKDGMLAFTDSTDNNQRVTISEKTRTNIERRIKETVATVVNQRFETGQTIVGATFYLPCGDTTVTQRSVTQVMAELFARNVTETVMQASEVRDWVAKVTGEDKQHSTDLFNSLFNNAAAAIGSVTGAFGLVGSSWVIGGMLIIFVILFVLPFAGGGNDRRRRGRDD